LESSGDHHAGRLGHTLPGDRQGPLRRRAGRRRGGHEPLPRRRRARVDRRRLRPTSSRGRPVHGDGARRSPRLRGQGDERHVPAGLPVGRGRRGVPECRPRLHRDVSLAPSGCKPPRDVRCDQPVGSRRGTSDLPRKLPVPLPHGARPGGNPGSAVEQGSAHQPSARGELRRQRGAPGDRHHGAPVAKGRRTSREVDRGSDGVPARGRQPGLGSPLRGVARGEEGRDAHRPPGQARRRPRGDR
jgi:hypothetical protein